MNDGSTEPCRIDLAPLIELGKKAQDMLAKIRPVLEMLQGSMLQQRDLEDLEVFRCDIERQLSRSEPEEVWHYTTESGLSGILKEKSVWSTQVSCLNDYKEGLHFLELIGEAMSRRPDPGDEINLQTAFARASELFLNTNISDKET